MTYVALLRGLNVGGKNRMTMKDLVAFFEATGCSDVRTYVQSGNVVFEAKAAIAAKVPAAVAKAIETKRGIRTPVVLRTAEALCAVPSANPFSKAAEDALHVAFLAEAPSAAQIAELDPKRSPPDEFAVLDREVYLHVPNGMGRTKLSNAYFDKKLGTTSTVRNWRTVLALVEMCG